mgnify:FL=1
MKRRDLLKLGALGGAALWLPTLKAGYSDRRDLSLRPADQNGVQLPSGFTSRIVARSGASPIGDCEYVWHHAPDGGACFPARKGGWIYVSNSELGDNAGGAGALSFDCDGRIIDAYPILAGTSRNCAGGATPWGTWLSCEEIERGQVWECDPAGQRKAVVRPALGRFKHEAVAVDPVNKQLYLTEDDANGALYRFTPDNYPDLSSGKLEAARVIRGVTDRVEWDEVEDPSASDTPTRKQTDSSEFIGGEGIVYYQGTVYFTTKGDNRVWAYDTDTHGLKIIYDHTISLTPILTGVDNITAASDGSLYVAEDGGDLQIVVITRSGELFPIVQLEGHKASEIAGVAFSPDESRLYFSSQRGVTGEDAGGITFEITGPFLLASIDR